MDITNKFFISMAIGLFCLFLNSDQPHEAASLNDEERKLLEARIFEGATQDRMNIPDAQAAKRPLTHRKI